MKTRFFGFLCTALFTVGILLGASGTALAHSMPYEEATLILDDYAGGQNELIPRKSTLGDAHRAIVRAGLADDYQKKDFTGDGMRIVTFSFSYAEEFLFRAVTGAQNTRDASALTITSYDAMGKSARTPSGFHVGMPYADVVEEYGEASFLNHDDPVINSYIYEFEGKAAELTFDVDDAGIIRALRFRTEI